MINLQNISCGEKMGSLWSVWCYLGCIVFPELNFVVLGYCCRKAKLFACSKLFQMSKLENSEV